ncbi:MAG: dihydroorotate dehydrogenase electron transfer subunit [Dehalococcoidales bacterium]|nr:dihydroorotate dehydrogenase electron transfer subunit [Dehalococcoidales bacterium]
MYQGKSRVISNEEITPLVNLLTAEAPEIAASATPGQFVMISCGEDNERLLRRPISLHRVRGDAVSFLFSVVGKGTAWLAGLKSGGSIDILGPLGNGFTAGTGLRKILLVAGGIGIAPLCFLAETAISHGKQVMLLEGAATASMLLPARFIPEGVKLVITTEDGTDGVKGLVTSLLTDHMTEAESVCVCGPLSMYRAIYNNYFNAMRHLPVEVSLEVRMGCGLGMCYACSIMTARGLKQVCKDGPVFRMDEVVWEDLK